jgi:hypothetical protein
LTNRCKLLASMAVLALVASLAVSSQTRADTLVVGSSAGPSITLTSFSPYDAGETVNGGNMPGSTLNSGSGAVTLPWVFCVDLQHNVTLNGTYNATTTTTTGIVNGAQVGGSTTVSDEIAYLVIKYGAGAVGNASGKEGALQGAIWTLEYQAQAGGNPIVSAIQSGFGTIAQMNSYVSEAQSANTTGDRTLVTWMSPGTSPGSGLHQGLITATPLQIQSIVPEPSTLAIAGLGALGFLGYGWKRRKRS